MTEAVALIAVNKNGKFLLYQRDANPDIPYPERWALLGGGVEEDETPEEAIEREIKEEIGINIAMYAKFKVYDWNGFIQHVYFIVLDLDLESTPCNEGQGLDYFTKEEIFKLDMMVHHKDILKEFLTRFP